MSAMCKLQIISHLQMNKLEFQKIKRLNDLPKIITVNRWQIESHGYLPRIIRSLSMGWFVQSNQQYFWFHQLTCWVSTDWFQEPVLNLKVLLMKTDKMQKTNTLKVVKINSLQFNIN